MEIHLTPEAKIDLSFESETELLTIKIKDKGTETVIYLNKQQFELIHAFWVQEINLAISKSLKNSDFEDIKRISWVSKMITEIIKSHKEEPSDTSFKLLIKQASLVLNSLSKPSAKVEIYIPAKKVHLSDSEKITNACGEFMEALGYELEAEEEPIYKSYWKKIKFVFSKQAAPEEIDRLMNKGKRALELKHVELPTAEQTEKLASAAAKIIESLANYEEGVARLGALLVLKKKIDGESKIIIQQLSQDLIKKFEEDSQLIKNLEVVYQLVAPDNEKPQKNVLDTPSQEIGVVSGSE